MGDGNVTHVPRVEKGLMESGEPAFVGPLEQVGPWAMFVSPRSRQR